MKFRLKMTLCMLWLLALVFGAGGGALITLSLRTALLQAESASLENYSANLRALQLVTASSMQKDYDTLCTTLRSLEGEQNWACVRLRAGQETILQDGSTELLTALTPEPDHCATQILQDTDDYGQTDVYLQISGLLSTSDETLQLDIAYHITDIYETQRGMLRVYTYVFLAVMALGGALSWGISYVLTKPLGKLSAASRRLAAGDLSCRVRPRTGDEVGQLCRDFNAMAAQLEENITELQQSMERQERFMGSFAHELKTPMTSIIGYADLLRVPGPAPAGGHGRGELYLLRGQAAGVPLPQAAGPAGPEKSDAGLRSHRARQAHRCPCAAICSRSIKKRTSSSNTASSPACAAWSRTWCSRCSSICSTTPARPWSTAAISTLPPTGGRLPAPSAFSTTGAGCRRKRWHI